MLKKEKTPREARGMLPISKELLRKLKMQSAASGVTMQEIGDAAIKLYLAPAGRVAK